MTAISIDTDDLNSFVEKWIRNNPEDRHLSPTQIVGRYILKYIHNEVNKNGKETK